MIKVVKKTVAEKNVEFNKLSAEDKRREVAMDTLAQYKRGTVNPSCVTNVAANDESEDSPTLKKGVKVKDILSDIKCDACLKGGLFLGFLSRTNKDFKIKYDGDISVDETRDIRGGLKPIFGDLQLDMMETAFEEANIVDRTKKISGNDIEESCIEFGNVNSGNNEAKFISILENVIEHGEFRPNVPARKITKAELQKLKKY